MQKSKNINWSDFLGIPILHNIDYLSFEEARKYVRSLGLKKYVEWKDWCKKEGKHNIPSNCSLVYKNEWKGWGDFLGNGNTATFNRKYLTFVEAKKYVRSLKLKTQKEWKKYANGGIKPENIPADPRWVYKREWKGIGDWLGTGNIATFDRKYKSFEDAKAFVKCLKFKSEKEWRIYCTKGGKPEDIPANPQKVYGKKWKGIGDWLGTGNIATFDRKYKSFEDAKAFVRTKGLKSEAEWKKYCRSGEKPSDIPSYPSNKYKPQWKGLGDWLGNNKKFRGNTRPFLLARDFVRKLGLESLNAWKDYCKSGKKPFDIPACPATTDEYKSQWKCWGDFLGTK